jgi:hypothetical protein
MKKQSFSERYNKLSGEAKDFIEQHMKSLKPKRVLHLFVPSKGDSDEDKDGNSIYDMPTFQEYDKHGGVTYANLTKLEINKYGVQVHGHDKEGFGTAAAYLHELDGQDIIWIADYLQS